MSNFEILHPEGVHTPTGKYSHAARINGGKLLVVAGQVPLAVDGSLVGEDDVADQTTQVFANIEAVLKGVDGSLANVVEFTYYIVGRENVQGFIEARTGIFDKAYPDGGYPPATLLVVGGLANEKFLLEVSALAVI